MELFNIIQNGGFVMYPLLFCSVVVWAVAIDKVLFLRNFQRQCRHLHDKAGKLILEKKVNEAKGLCHNVHPMVGIPYLALFEKNDLDKELWEGRIERRMRETQQGLRRFLWILGTIGSSAPFIGLFGTVVGIIKSFDSIAQTGKSGFAIVAAGLSEALVATAAGIIVAVMAVIFYNYFQTRLVETNLNFKHRLEDLIDLF